MLFLFWLSILLLVYVYAGYPLVLWGCRLLRRQKIHRGPYRSSVDIIIPAYNEERVIAAKINNTLNLEYPPELLTITVISDGSSDGTDLVVQRFEARGIRFIRQDTRQGKAAALNRGLAESRSKIVVFTDASILLAPSALKNILKPFNDPTVGCVSGEDHIPAGGGEGLYGRYELAIRNLESCCASIVGASGCFYAQRRVLAKPFTEGRAPDFLSVLSCVDAGYRAVTEPSAVGVMGRLSASRDEYQRKQRTIIRGITALMDYKHMLDPRRYGFFAFELWSHKILRWSVGGLMVLAFLSNLYLIHRPFYLLLLACQAAFYALAAVAWRREAKGRAPGGLIFRIPLFLCVANFAALVAWVRYLSGRRQELWESSKR